MDSHWYINLFRQGVLTANCWPDPVLINISGRFLLAVMEGE